MKAKDHKIANALALRQDAAGRWHNSRGPAVIDVAELFLAELRIRRERLKELLRLVNQAASREQASTRSHVCSRRVS
ncbi:hypothetical protein SBA3_2200002 [Candidatus Sulfopaludibacter sp. SbA3]|nr:hypothetical protein SBA3_2200002 [Candidatus Sulfopaludibacter sp. SbA3]